MKPAPRLTRIDWIKAGLRLLVAQGASGMRLDSLTRDMGATKGSFYWHFTDMAALRAAMLETWEQVATQDIGLFLGANASPPDRLRLLVELVSVVPPDELGGLGAEPALRDWARIDPQARAAVARVDARRLADLRLWCRDAGLDPELAGSIYAQITGLMALRLTQDIDMASELHRFLDLLTRQAAPRP